MTHFVRGGSLRSIYVPNCTENANAQSAGEKGGLRSSQRGPVVITQLLCSKTKPRGSWIHNHNDTASCCLCPWIKSRSSRVFLELKVLLLLFIWMKFDPQVPCGSSPKSCLGHRQHQMWRFLSSRRCKRCVFLIGAG